jgi:hypothetical protein
MHEVPQPTDPLNQVLNRRPAPFIPVAPSYEGLGPLEFHRMELRWRKWRDRLDTAGTDRLPVDFQTSFDLALEVHTDILDTCYPPPAWLALPHISTPADIEGSALLRRGDDLYWLDRDGAESWIPPNRVAYHAKLAADRDHRFFHLWAEGNASESLEELAARARSAQRPEEPTPEQVQAELDSPSYDLARALLRRYPDNLPLYAGTGSPYNSLLHLLSFQGMMAALVESPNLVHQILESYLPAPSARRIAERSLGIGIMFIEECLASADLISPDMYLEFSFPYTKHMLQHYEDLGFRTVLYFSGNPMPILEHLRQLPFTAIIFEEDRKDYGIDLAEIRRAMGPDRILFGNVDAYFLEKASDEEVLAEVRRQIDVAGRDGNFVLSVGSPFTPDTSLERVRLFCQSTRMI